MNIASIGIDPGKTIFHLVALGERNKILLRKKFSRSQLLAYTANLPVSLIGLEACAGAHFVGTALREQGHQVRLIPAQFVKPYRKSNKNDFLDAEAIAEAVPVEQRKLQQASNKKAEQAGRLFKILPEAFVFDYAGRQGDLVTLTFRPNPKFQPPSLEARVFHSMQGEMTVDIKQERLAALHGHLMEDVSFGGGLLGHLDKGGKFEVRQTEVAAGQWEMTTLGVDMKGKALLFKTIGVYETENHSDFQREPDDLTLAEAAGILNRQIVVADNR
jgi:hypothetical protein